MFKLGETYYTKGGYEARIVCDNANILVNNQQCDLIAILTKGTTKVPLQPMPLLYSPKGHYNAAPNNVYDLISNEANEEELALIRQIKDLSVLSKKATCEEDRDERLLKVIRQLRKK